MCKYLFLKDVLPENKFKVVFQYMEGNLPANFDKVSLDFLLISECGNAIVSPMIDLFINENNKISVEDLTKISNILYNKYIEKWNRLYNSLIQEYNPLNNYDKTQTITEDIIENENGDVDMTYTETESTENTRTPNLKSTINNTGTGSGNGTTQTKGYGWNGGDSQPKEDTVTTNNSESNTTQTSNETGTETITSSNSKNNTEKGTKKNNNNTKRTFTDNTSGNIGVTTSQQMLESEVELREKYNIINIMINDMKNSLTIPIY